MGENERKIILIGVDPKGSRLNGRSCRTIKNRNGEAPLVKVFKRDAYKRVSDTLGVERYQSVPLYLLTDTVTPEIYGRDGSLVRIKAMDEDSKFARIQTVYDGEEEWYAPKKYIKQIGIR